MNLPKNFWPLTILAIIFLVLVIVFGPKWAGIKYIDEDEIEMYD